jgi:hypothetical protein
MVRETLIYFTTIVDADRELVITSPCLDALLKMVEHATNRDYVAIPRITKLFLAFTNLSQSQKNAQSMGDNGIVGMVVQCMFAVRDHAKPEEDLQIKITGAKLLQMLAIENGIVFILN